MRIAFCGKGGTGKTTLASCLIQILAKSAKNVLAVDADPALTLQAALGIGREAVTPIAEMKGLIHERMEVKPEAPFFYKLNPNIDDIPGRFALKKGNITLMVMGTVAAAGSGCVCPESAFLKTLLHKLVVGEDEHVILDMEAGVEHLGRSTIKSVDTAILVTEPTAASAAVSRRIHVLAKELGVKQTRVLGNKIRNKEDEEFLRKQAAFTDIAGVIPYDEKLMDRARSGGADLAGSHAYSIMEEIYAKALR